MSDLEKELKKVIDVAIEVFNGEEFQKKYMERLQKEYTQSKTAKHTKEEWEELKMSIIKMAVFDYYLKHEDEKAKLCVLVLKELQKERVGE